MPQPWSPLTGATHRVALEVLLNGPLSRAELSRRVDLSPGSLTRLTKPLIDSGLLVEVEGSEDARVGRPSQPLDVRALEHHFIGIKITGDEAHGVLTTLRADVLAEVRVPLAGTSPGEVVAVVSDVVARLGAGTDLLDAVGVSIGGHVTRDDVVRRAPFLGWENVALGSLLAQELAVPVTLANDVTALTEATHWFGEGRGLDQFALITIGAGIGFGLVTHGTLVTNEDAGLGLLGHYPLDPLGPLCWAGHRGCASAVLTTTAIADLVSQAHRRPVTYDEALALASAGDPAARRVVDDAGRALGTLIAAAANFTMPELVVLGGEGAALADVAAEAVVAATRAGRDPLAHLPRTVTQPGGFRDWARGAAVMAIQAFVGAR